MIFNTLKELSLFVNADRCPKNTVIDLSYRVTSKHVNDDQVITLANLLTSGKTTTGLHVNLRGNMIKDQGANHFAESLMYGNAPHWLVLNLKFNFIGESGAKSLANVISSGKAPRGLELNLASNNLKNAGIIAFAEALKSGNAPQGLVLKLGLNYKSNENGDAGAIALADAIKSGKAPKGLVLNLRYNKIGNAGAIALAEALESDNAPDGLQLNLLGNSNIDTAAPRLRAAMKKYLIAHGKQLEHSYDEKTPLVMAYECDDDDDELFEDANSTQEETPCNNNNVLTSALIDENQTTNPSIKVVNPQIDTNSNTNDAMNKLEQNTSEVKKASSEQNQQKNIKNPEPETVPTPIEVRDQPIKNPELETVFTTPIQVIDVAAIERDRERLLNEQRYKQERLREEHISKRSGRIALGLTLLSCLLVVTIPFAPLIYNRLYHRFYQKQINQPIAQEKATNEAFVYKHDSEMSTHKIKNLLQNNKSDHHHVYNTYIQNNKSNHHHVYNTYIAKSDSDSVNKSRWTAIHTKLENVHDKLLNIYENLPTFFCCNGQSKHKKHKGLSIENNPPTEFKKFQQP